MLEFLKNLFGGKTTDAKGNQYVMRNGRPAIVPADPRDKAILACAQQATMGGATLPSGFEVPHTEGKVWRVEGDALVQYDKEE